MRHVWVFWRDGWVARAGEGVNTLNLETVGLDEVSQAISKCKGFVIGSPTLGGHMPTQVSTTAPTSILVPARNSIASTCTSQCFCQANAALAGVHRLFTLQCREAPIL